MNSNSLHKNYTNVFYTTFMPKYCPSCGETLFQKFDYDSQFDWQNYNTFTCNRCGAHFQRYEQQYFFVILVGSTFEIESEFEKARKYSIVETCESLQEAKAKIYDLTHPIDPVLTHVKD